MLAQQCLELASMFTARVSLRPVDASPVPCQPATRLSVDVLPVAQVQQLVLE